MSYITSGTRHLSLAELNYSEEENVLTVGKKTLPLEPGWIEAESPWLLVPFDGPNQLEQANVCLNAHIKPIGTPQFHKWLGAVAGDMGRLEEVRASTIKVMSFVFTKLNPSIEVSASDNPGSYGFNMAATKYNHANLHTFGDCACLHQNPEGHWVNSRDWGEGYCEYDWHNTDADTQVWSLLAGIGHLARLASQQAVKG